jgi:hypothetical protein
MRTGVLKKAIVLAAATLLLSGCGGGGVDMDALIAKYKLNANEKLAFEACDKRMRSVKAIIKVSGKDQMMSNIPAEVCACQARTMATVFKTDKFNSLTGFGLWLAKVERKKKVPSVIKLDLKGTLSSETAGLRLARTFDSCASKYLADNKDSEELKGFLQPPPPPKKKKGEEKQASAG